MFSSNSDFDVFIPTGFGTAANVVADTFQTGVVDSPTQSRSFDFGAFDDGVFRARMDGEARFVDASNPGAIAEVDPFDQLSNGSITVVNLRPQLLNTSDTVAVVVGQPVNLAFDYIDPGPADTLFFEIDDGNDGTIDAMFTDTASLTELRLAPESLFVPYLAQSVGSRLLRVSVRDDDGGSVSRVFTVNAVAVPEPSMIALLFMVFGLTWLSNRACN